MLMKAKNTDSIKRTINDLFHQISSAKGQRQKNLLVHKARNLAMKHRYKIPRSLQKIFCKHCYEAFSFGENVRVRTREKMVIYYCLSCKKYMRFPLRGKAKKTG